MNDLSIDLSSYRANHKKPTTIITVLFIVMGIWLFLEIANLVMDDETINLDQMILHALWLPGSSSLFIENPWLLNTVRDITALGGYTVLTILTVLVTLYLGLRRKLDLMVLSLITIIGGAAVSSTLKVIFARERPDIEHLVEVTTKSFPSGHAMQSTVVYLILAILLSGTTSRTSIKLFFLCSAIIISFLVGASRVYLGVHYPTDVFAGWIGGGVWIMICILVAGHTQGYVDIFPHLKEGDSNNNYI